MSENIGTRDEGRDKVIFVGAHPDDVELGCGGSIAYFVASGFEAHCIFLTRGEKCGDAERRTEESLAACRGLGVDERHVVFGGWRDTALPESADLIEFLEGWAKTVDWSAAVAVAPVESLATDDARRTQHEAEDHDVQPSAVLRYVLEAPDKTEPVGRAV